jgi:hypothetical protein
MDHGYFKDRISGYLDGELPDYEMEALRDHLEQCEECRGVYERLKQVDVLVEQHADLADGDFWEEQAQKIEARLGFAGQPEIVEVPVRRWSGLGWKLAAVAASVAALIFIGVNQTDIFRQGEERTAPAVVEKSSPDLDSPEKIRNIEIRPEVDEAGQAGPATDTVRQESSAQSGQGAAPKKQISPEQEKTMGYVPAAPSTAAPREKAAVADNEAAALADEPTLKREEAARAVESVLVAEGHRIEESPSTISPAARPNEIIVQEPSRDRTIKVLGKEDKLSLSEESAKPVARPTPSDLSLSATMPAGTDTSGAIDWPRRADSLFEVWEELSSDRYQLAVTKGRKRAALMDIETVERQLLEAKYQAARMLQDTDPDRFGEIVQFLRGYIERPDALHRETARLYLSELTELDADSAQSGP